MITIKNNKNENKTKEIFPVRYFDDEMDAFILKDESYFDIVEKVAEDIDNMLDDEVQLSMYTFTKFLKVYKADFKITSLNYPTSTNMEQSFLRKKLNETIDPNRKLWIQRSIDELEKAAKGTKIKEYYFLIFSKTKDEHFENMNTINAFGNQFRKLSKNKRENIIYKFNNMNSLLKQEKNKENEYVY